LRIHCIGAGHWGPNLIRNFLAHPDVTVGTVFDLDRARLESFRRRFPGIETSTETRAAFDDPAADAVVIATPFRTHHALAHAALEAGKHVLVEKPLCPTVEECDDLIELAESSGLVLAVGHVFLFNPGIVALRGIVASGELGEIRTISARRTNLGPYRFDANALWDLVSHDLSIFRCLLGAAPVSVSATGGAFLDAKLADVVNGTFRYQDGALASFSASWLDPRKVREIVVVGSEKMATWDDMNLLEPLRVYDKSMALDPPEPSASHTEFMLRTRDGEIRIPKVRGQEPLAAECAHFVECIRAGIPPQNDARTARDLVAELIAADRSIETGGAPVEIAAETAAELAAEPALGR
jgi:predicted dehydrogenase